MQSASIMEERERESEAREESYESYESYESELRERAKGNTCHINDIRHIIMPLESS